MLTDTRAASMAEYAVIAAIVIAVAVGVFGTLGDKIEALDQQTDRWQMAARGSNTSSRDRLVDPRGDR